MAGFGDDMMTGGGDAQNPAKPARQRSTTNGYSCQHLIHRRDYLEDPKVLRQAYLASEKLVAKLQSMRHSLLGEQILHEEPVEYTLPGTTLD